MAAYRTFESKHFRDRVVRIMREVERRWPLGTAGSYMPALKLLARGEPHRVWVVIPPSGAITGPVRFIVDAEPPKVDPPEQVLGGAAFLEAIGLGEFVPSAEAS
jgi:hypothetical protein